jgi:TonB family protein
VSPILLFVKCILVLSVASMASLTLRRKSAAARHLLWLSALSAILLMPLASQIPNASLKVPASITTSVVGLASITPVHTMFQLRWLTAIWIVGTVALLIRLFIGTLSALSIVRSAKTVSQDAAYEVRATSRLSSPIAWGIGPKLMLLPDSALTWNHNRRDAILRHETSHLRRYDCWALLIAEVACALYWCNPLVWFDAAQMRKEQEHAADDEVLNTGIDPAEYADHLVAIARAARPPLLAAGAVNRSHLTTRIEAILDGRRNRTMANRRLLLASITALFAITLPLASMQAQRKTYKVSDAGVISPRLIEKHEPEYTKEAKEAKIEGSVGISAIVDIDGRAHDIKVARGLDEGLDANAIAAIATWRFAPAQKDGEPVPVSVNIEVNFRLM